jgi:hypothetical protein
MEYKSTLLTRRNKSAETLLFSASIKHQKAKKEEEKEEKRT